MPVVLSLISGYLPQSSDVAPKFSPVCFSLSGAKSVLPLKDVEDIREKWRSKEIVTLKSGNYGIFRNDTFYVIDKDTPVLKELRLRFELAKKILVFGEDGRAKICQYYINGSELTNEELETLSRLVDRWTGISLPVDSYYQSKSLLMMIAPIYSFGSSGQTLSVFPGIRFDSQEAYKDYQKSQLKVGLLKENSASIPVLQRRPEGPVVGVEAPDGAMFIRIYGARSAKTDYLGINSTLLEIVAKIHDRILLGCRSELLKLSSSIRKLPYSGFDNFEQQGLSEADAVWTRKGLLGQLEQNGYSSQEAESRVKSLKFSGRDICISFQTRIQPYGRDANNFASTIRIWP